MKTPYLGVLSATLQWMLFNRKQEPVSKKCNSVICRSILMDRVQGLRLASNGASQGKTKESHL